MPDPVAHRPRLSWAPILVLAATWAIGPAIPALLRGELIGHGYTDLYPSVWGMWAFAQSQPGLPSHTALLGFPDGMGFAYSSPLRGWFATPLIPLIGVKTAWNGLLLSARAATVVSAWAAARAWGLRANGALAAAALYACSPFFHGYAVEGIVEGSDGWTLALLVWALGVKRVPAAALALGLTLWSSWYLGAAGCLLVALAGFRHRASWWAMSGVALAAPALMAFGAAFPARPPLPAEIRAAMGAQIGIPIPGITPGLQPFAMNAYIGWVAVAAAAASRSRWVWLALIPAALSLGVGPIYDLPIFDQIRFPYRWHAATLALLALPVGLAADRWRRGWLIGPLIATEALLLGPTEPILPGASADVPALYDQVDGPVLDVPGPVSMPPGQINRSRGRAQYLLYNQTKHGQASPWIPDFNSVGVAAQGIDLSPIQAWDPLESGPPAPLPPDWVAALHRSGLRYVIVHTSELRGDRSRQLADALDAAGAEPLEEAQEMQLWRLPAPPVTR